MLTPWMLCAALTTPLWSDAPVISEFLAANDHILADEDGDFSDWLEVHNPGAVDVDLGGWFLTDDDGDLMRWTIPVPTVIPAGGFLVVFASGKDRGQPGTELHTDFKLSASGEYLALVDADGVTVVHEYAPSFPAQQDDVSYGLTFDSQGVTDTLSYFPLPTPEQPNGSGGPGILDVEHQPPLPTVDDTIVVTARVIVPPGRTLTTVELTWIAMYKLPVPVAMTDDGAAPDVNAGDDIWTAQIPSGQTLRGRMMRWRIRAVDDAGVETRAPSFLDPEDSPEYFGTILSDPRLNNELPVVHWFSDSLAQARTRTGARCSMYYEGRFYDNIFVRLRGGSSASFPKPSLKFDFNRGHHLQWSSPEFGITSTTSEEINLNTTWSDKAYLRRNLAFEIYRDSGVEASASFPVRVQGNGRFFEVATFVEQPDDDFLDRVGLDGDGALYKMFNQMTHAYSGVEKKTRRHEDHSDLERLVQMVSRRGNTLERYLFDEVDLPAVISYIAATSLMHDNDHVAKNYYVWRDTEGDQEWRFVPWDKDLTLGRNYTSGGGVLNDTMWADDDPFSHPLFGDRNHQKVDNLWNRFVDGCHRNDRVREMYLRRLRTLMDELLQEPGTSDPLKLEARIEELYAQMAPDVVLDENEWGIPSWGIPLDFRAGLDQLKNDYLAVRRQHLFQTHSVPGAGIIPGPQEHSHLRFGVVETSPSSGDPLEKFIEVRNPNDVAVDLSGWRVQGGVQFEFPPGSVIPSQDRLYLSPHLPSFRARGTFPTGDRKLLVLGPWNGRLFDGDSVFLLDPEGIVVATNGLPWLTLRDLVPGKTGEVSVVGSPVGKLLIFLASATGPGPVDTAYGPMDLSLPLITLGIRSADEARTAEVRVQVPPGLGGIQIWFQAFDVTSRSFTNMIPYVLP